MASEEGGGGFDRLVYVDGVGDGLDAGGDVGMASEEVVETFVVCVVAEDVDGVDSLLDNLLPEQDAGQDDRDDHDDEGNGGADVAVLDLCGEPVVGMLGCDGEDNGSDDGGEKRLEDKSAEKQGADGEEKEGDLAPGLVLAGGLRFLHEGDAPVDWRSLLKANSLDAEAGVEGIGKMMIAMLANLLCREQ